MSRWINICFCWLRLWILKADIWLKDEMVKCADKPSEIKEPKMSTFTRRSYVPSPDLRNTLNVTADNNHTCMSAHVRTPWHQRHVTWIEGPGRFAFLSQCVVIVREPPSSHYSYYTICWCLLGTPSDLHIYTLATKDGWINSPPFPTFSLGNVYTLCSRRADTLSVHCRHCCRCALMRLCVIL